MAASIDPRGPAIELINVVDTAQGAAGVVIKAAAPDRTRVFAELNFSMALLLLTRTLASGCTANARTTALRAVLFTMYVEATPLFLFTKSKRRPLVFSTFNPGGLSSPRCPICVPSRSRRPRLTSHSRSRL